MFCRALTKLGCKLGRSSATEKLDLDSREIGEKNTTSNGGVDGRFRQRCCGSELRSAPPWTRLYSRPRRPSRRMRGSPRRASMSRFEALAPAAEIERSGPARMPSRPLKTPRAQHAFVYLPLAATAVATLVAAHPLYAQAAPRRTIAARTILGASTTVFRSRKTNVEVRGSLRLPARMAGPLRPPSF